MKRLTVKKILSKTVEYFKEHQIDNPRLDAEVLLAYVLDMERINLYVNFNKPLKKSEIDQYRKLIVARRKGFPVAYIIGNQEFMSLNFKINQNVLIPRPETEHLVETALEEIKQTDLKEVKVVDIGTGSGAIIISLVKLSEKKTEGIAVDISKEALTLAEKNAKYHKVEDKIEFKLGNLLSPVTNQVDVIVSNPPYIPTNSLNNLQEEVKKEPRLALDGGDDGLDYYRKIIKQANNKLNSKGLILFEVGINQANDVADLFKKFDFKEIEIIKDYADIKRVVKARYF